MLSDRSRTWPGRVPGLAGLDFGGGVGSPGASWASLGHLLGALGRLLGSLGCLLAGLGHLLGASWLSGTAPTSILGASGTNFEGPKAPILEDLASILSKRFHSIPFPAYHCVPCYSMPLPFQDNPFKDASFGFS